MERTVPQKFFVACSTGNAAVVRELLASGVNPEVRDSNHLTGLIWAGRKGHTAVADVLLEYGAAIDAGDIRNRTAVFHAVCYKRYEYVQFMAGKGANLNVVDTHGWTATDFSISNRNTKMLDLLLSLGGYSAKNEA